MLQFLVVLLIVSLNQCATNTTWKTVCVRPTDPPHTHYDCTSQTDCLTLNDWIRIGGSLFTNNNTMVLLDGVHFINSTKNDLVIRDIDSVILTSRKNNATVTCAQEFRFKFINCSHINVSTIVFNSCVLYFSSMNNTQLSNITMINSKLMIQQALYLKNEELGHYGTVNGEKQCIFHDYFDIIDSTFQNSSIDMEVSVSPDSSSYTSCTQLSIRGVVINEMRESTITIMKAYNVFLTNIMIHKNKARLTTVLTVFSVHKLTLTDVKVDNNSGSMTILNFQAINSVKITGGFIFRYNHGTWGIIMQQIKKVWTASNSTLKFNKNVCKFDLFHFERVTELSSKLYLYTSTLIFEDNHVKGAIMHLNVVHLQVYNSNVSFRRNKSLQTGNLSSTSIPSAVLFLQNSEFFLFRGSTLVFSHNIAALSGGITLMSSTVLFSTKFNTTILFEFNEGGDGGGMAFYENSYIKLPPIKNKWYIETIDIHFYYNWAHGRGGAIFVKDTDYIHGLTGYQLNFFVSRPTFEPNTPKVHLHLDHNFAKVSGNDLYGGWIDNHRLKDIFLLSWIPANNYDSRYAIASDPIRICICSTSFPMCNETDYPISVFPGQTFPIKVVAVGQRMGIVPSVVTAELSGYEGWLGEGQGVQGVGRECTTLKFTIFSLEKTIKLELKVRDVGLQNQKKLYRQLQNSKYHVLIQQFSVSIKVEKCPLGFLFKPTLKTCLCLKSINIHSGAHCDYDTFSISKAKHKWMSATYEHNDTQHHGVIIYDQCPYDYCRTDPDPLFFHLEFPDDQCAFNRSGVLCGACQTNFSHVFGTSRCIKCSSIPLLAVIPGIVFAGVVLVIFLLLFNLTVSVGTLNGLIFYANIIRASQAIFYPAEISSSFLSVFIAWLNLDLGIETCFYDGLDAYAKTWLQFVFPIYIWLMVIVIIIASHYSTKVSKAIPNNALQVLATLFLLSYAKILRIVITVFSSTVLIYPDGFKKRVWLYDGNIEFFWGKHIPLCIATLLLLILLSIPYTLSLVSIQWLQKISHYRLLFWVHRLMPLFDAYTGPYKHKHRYWTGVLLIVRVVILIIFTLNQTNNPAVNLLTILVMSVALLAYASYVHVYKNWLYSMLEITSLLNLALLSATSFYQLLNDNGLVLTTSVSISAAVITFAFILLFHATLQLKSSKKIRNLMSFLTTKSRIGREQREEQIDIGPIVVAQDLTHTSVELHECLLDGKDEQ